ncbi:DNA polymerase III subunit delta [Candidatus Wirthbacteria bacterium CG2_30_54_11]|uniref:DNA polymerase III subunit delta n=1 Tax=Candidatus Wirthbacteria bacterium CG2_30_54_11 TaxID=1817892 RepID=A0A1J5IVG1_9BACT|nr:MAG: DNA polymerase III subunit delta [Candidatus Wirthbacteria bacterium CG2_30_54_11]
MIHVVFGEERYLAQERIREIRDSFTFVNPDFNIEHLDGPKSSLSEVRSHAAALPFLDAHRLVIVHGLLAAKKAPSAEELKAFFAEVPDYSEIVFVEDALDRRTQLAKVVLEHAQVHECAALKTAQIPQWIRDRAALKKGAIDPEAVSLLSSFVGTDLSLIDQELEKLLAYSAGGQISAQAVRDVSHQSFEEDVYTLVDSLATKRKDRAITLLHRNILSGTHPLSMLSMIIRQFRLLIAARDLIDQHRTQADLIREWALHPYVAQKVFQQARSYSMPQLKQIYGDLSRLDRDIKYGVVEGDLALDLWIAGLSA